MTDNHLHRALTVALLPDESFQLEYDTKNSKQTKSSTQLQQEIFSAYETDRRNRLLFLGFSDPAVPLPASLEFWRRFSALFVYHLRLTPDLERLRHQVEIPLPEQKVAELLETLPAMIGGEYITTKFLAALWSDLTLSFSTAIQQYSSSVAEFIHRYAPNNHLLGRVYFHLVENKDPDASFANVKSRVRRVGRSMAVSMTAGYGSV